MEVLSIRLSRYCCDPITTLCIVLRRLTSRNLWDDLKVYFWGRNSKLGKIFWKRAQRFVSSGRHLVAFHGGLMQERAALYAEAFTGKEFPLNRFVSFIDYNKIAMERPDGKNSVKCSCYSGQINIHCLRY